MSGHEFQFPPDVVKSAEISMRPLR